MFNIRVDYPDEAEETRIVEATTSVSHAKVERVIGVEEILALQTLVLKIPAAKYLVEYATRLVRATRPKPQSGAIVGPDVPDFVKKYVSWGAGPRAGQSLVMAAKARALLHGRTYLSGEDLRAVAAPVLRHRVITNYNAEADGITPDEIVRRLLAAIPKEKASSSS